MATEIMDFAILGGQLFKDAKLAAAGPVAWYRKRRASIDLPEDVLKRTSLIAKWWQGAANRDKSKVFYDMLPRDEANPRPRMPKAWAEELPEAVALAKHDYRRVVCYAGSPRNATNQHIAEMTHYLLDVCKFDGLILDAAGTIRGPRNGEKTDPDFYKIAGITYEVSARGLMLGFEPVPFANTFQHGVKHAAVFVEDDPAGEKANLGWFVNQSAKVRPRVLPDGSGRLFVAAQVNFDAAHCEKREAEGWSPAVNFRKPEVQAWRRARIEAGIG